MSDQTKSRFLDIPTPDGLCDSFLAQPEKAGHSPGVLLLMDAFGLRPYLQEMAKTLASRGFTVVVPNTFYRIKRAPVVSLPFPLKLEDLPHAIKEIMPLARGYEIESGLQDMKVFLDFLENQKGFNGKTGVTGYCMGGSLAIRTAARYAGRISAVASFHAGNLASELPDSPHLLLPQIKAELYVAHADNDASMPKEQIEKFHQALIDAKSIGHAEVYQGAFHGFTMEDLPAFNQAALAKHWVKLFDLFDRTLN
ncbi:MAG: dienelactone hydrolase family protein [Bdellovibrionales bacterium]